jgi:hypothetical protein
MELCGTVVAVRAAWHCLSELPQLQCSSCSGKFQIADPWVLDDLNTHSSSIYISQACLHWHTKSPNRYHFRFSLTTQTSISAIETLNYLSIQVKHYPLSNLPRTKIMASSNLYVKTGSFLECRLLTSNSADSPASAGNRGQIVNSASLWKCVSNTKPTTLIAYWFVQCNCAHGFFNIQTDVVCPNCNVRRCSACGVC